MSLVEDYTCITNELIKFLKVNKDSKEDTVEEYIQSVSSLLQQRQEILNQMNPPFSLEEKKLMNLLVSLEEELAKLLETAKLDTANELSKIQTLKRGNNKYVNAYEDFEVDAVFYDKKK